MKNKKSAPKRSPTRLPELKDQLNLDRYLLLANDGLSEILACKFGAKNPKKRPSVNRAIRKIEGSKTR